MLLTSLLILWQGCFIYYRTMQLFRILSFVMLLSQFNVDAQTIDVRILSRYRISAFSLIIKNGNYRNQEYLSDSNYYNIGDTLSFFIKNSQLGIIYKNKDSVLLKSNQFILGRNKINSNFLLVYDTSIVKPAIYQGNLKVFVRDSSLWLINNVDFEQYLAAVIQAESGTKANEEFYKAQAVISRTYAYKNIQRHGKEGYDLCDDVHCQVYKGMCTHLPIQMAVFETSGLCITDKNNQLIDALFHAHCGGQTNHSEDVWRNALPYLRSVIDTFCLPMKNAQWQQKIAVSQWLDFAKNKGYSKLADSIILQQALVYKQPFRKSLFDGGFKMPLPQIRSNFGLKSTFFEIASIESDSLVFTGRGYGHGVGLCQSGAMRMAVLGFSFGEIVKFYYKDVEIKSIPFPKIMGTK